MLVTDEDAFDMTRRCAKEEDTSSGATLAAVKQKESDIASDSRILIFSYDFGGRYLSIEDLFL